MAVLVFLGALAPLAGRVPSQIVSVHSELRPAVLSTLHVLLYQFGSDTNDVLAFQRGVRQYSMCCFPTAI